MVKNNAEPSKSSGKSLGVISSNTSGKNLPASATSSSPPDLNEAGDAKPSRRKLEARDGEEYKSVRKLKSAADSKKGVKGVTVQKGAEWKQPLRRHINPETNAVEFVTILVRVLSGDAEHDFHARFPPTPLLAENVCSAIAEKEQLTIEESRLFSLWVISKDLEIQIRPDQNIFDLMVCWHRWVMKYTHFPEAEDPAHHVNRHWFIYRREAVVSLRLERELAGEVAVGLLYGEAKRNILTKRYVCSQLESATIAGYQLQMAYGDYSIDRSPPGYLIKDDRLNQLLPLGMADRMRPTQWEEIITVQYKSLLGFDKIQCQQGFLDFIRHMPCYGSSFFPVCAELPPSGFFEFRTQNWFLGAGPNGMCIIDTDVQKYVYHLNWKDIKFKAGPDQFFIYQTKGERTKEIQLITPQGKMIENLAIRHKYSWAKETGKLKSKDVEQQPTILKSEEMQNKRKSFLPISQAERKKSITPQPYEKEAEDKKKRKSFLPQSLDKETEDRLQSRRKSSVPTDQPSDHSKSNSRRKESTSSVKVPSASHSRKSSVSSNEPEQSRPSLKAHSESRDSKEGGDASPAKIKKPQAKQKAKKEASLPIFTEEVEEKEEPALKKSGLFSFSKQNLNEKTNSKGNLTEQGTSSNSRGNLTETLKGSKERIAGSLDNLGRKISKSMTKLLQTSDDIISPNREKIIISAEEMNIMVASTPAPVSNKILPSANHETSSTAAATTTADISTSAIVLPSSSSDSPASTGAAVSPNLTEVTSTNPNRSDGGAATFSAKPGYKARIPVIKRTAGLAGSSQASIEFDLLSQLDDIANATGVQVKREPTKHTPNPSSTVAEVPKLVPQSVDEPPPLPAKEQIYSSPTDQQPKNEEEEVIRIPKTPPLSKKELADSLKIAAPVEASIATSPTTLPSSLGKKSHIAGPASPSGSSKSSPSSSRKSNSPSPKKVSKFGKLGDQIGSGPAAGGSSASAKKTYSVKKPSALSAGSGESSSTPILLETVQSPPADPDDDINDDEGPYEAPTSFTPTARRASQLPTGTLGTTIDVSKVKQRQSKLITNNSSSGIVRRSDDVFSLDEYIGGVAETELIDKRSTSKRNRGKGGK